MSTPVIESLQRHPELANILSGVSSNQTLIGEKILAPINVGAEWFEYETYSNHLLEDPGTEQRALYGATPEISRGSASRVEGTLGEFARRIFIDYREIAAAEARDRMQAAVGGMSHAERLRLFNALRVQKQLEILKEKSIATIVQTATNYTSDLRITDCVFDTDDLITKFGTYSDTVEGRWGVVPDTLVMGHKAWRALTANADLMDRISGGSTTGNPALITKQLIAGVLGLKQILVGTAVTQVPAAAGTYGTPTRLWTDDFAALVYTGTSGLDANGDAIMPDQVGIDPVFGFLAYMNNPNTGVRYDVTSYDRDGNGKVEVLEGTEFHKAVAVAPVGVHFANADQ